MIKYIKFTGICCQLLFVHLLILAHLALFYTLMSFSFQLSDFVHDASLGFFVCANKLVFHILLELKVISCHCMSSVFG